MDPVAGILLEPATQHPYAYGLNNPLRFRDPSGRQYTEVLRWVMQEVPWTELQQLGREIFVRLAPVVQQVLDAAQTLGPKVPAWYEQVQRWIQQFSRRGQENGGGSGSGGGETAGPGGLDPDKMRENAVRKLLEGQGYEQPYGTSDDMIRKALEIKGRVSDIVGYNRQCGRWVVAESKGSDLDRALQQLENTMNALIKAQPSAEGSVELRIYMKAIQYQRLIEGGLPGWELRNGYLGWTNEMGEWFYANANGVRVLVESAGQ